MLETYASLALTCALSLLVGRAVMAACRRESWTGLEPAVGFAALMFVGGFLARVPGHGRGASLGLALIVIASLVALRLPYRTGLRTVHAWVAGLVAVAAVSIPFAITGHWGLIGIGYNNDLGLHLAWAEQLKTGIGTAADSGYPLGPHALAQSLARIPGISLGPAFTGELLAIPVLTVLTALKPMRGLGPARRVLAATLVGLAYLGASYLAQAAFKELAQALFVLAFAIAMPQMSPLPAGRRERTALLAPLAVLALGIVFTYSFPGLAWPVAIGLLWVLSRPSVHRGGWRRVKSVARRPATAIAVLVVAAVAALTLWGPFGFEDTFSEVASANTYGPVSVIEALGLWPSPDYRLDGTHGVPLPGLWGAIAVLALILSLVWWIRRSETYIPLAFAACGLLYALSIPFTGDYSLAKALTIGAPIVMLLIVRALLCGPAGGWRARAPRARLIRVGWGALALVFCAGAAFSSFLALRDTPVAPPGHGSELAAFEPYLAGKTVLYAGQDRYAAYELRGSYTDVPIVEFPDPKAQESPTKPFDTGDAYSPIDFDSFKRQSLQEHTYVITGAAAWNSHPPANFEEIARTPSYILWRRTGPTPMNRRTLIEGVQPAAPIKCDEPETKILVHSGGTATVFPDARVGSKESWQPDSELGGGESATQTLNLKPGRWLLSLQYFSPTGLTLTAPGFRQEIKPALDGQRPPSITLLNNGQFWPAGEIDVKRAGPVEFRITADGPSWIQRLTGYDRKSYIGQISAVRDKPRQRVPLSETCGRWLDSYRGEMVP